MLTPTETHYTITYIYPSFIKENIRQLFKGETADNNTSIYPNVISISSDIKDRFSISLYHDCNNYVNVSMRLNDNPQYIDAITLNLTYPYSNSYEGGKIDTNPSITHHQFNPTIGFGRIGNPKSYFSNIGSLNIANYYNNSYIIDTICAQVSFTVNF